MERTIQDIRYALRTLAARPGFTLVAILTLTLGIGANATVFTWAKSILVAPLPGVSRSDEIVQLVASSAEERNTSLSNPDYRDIAARATTIEGLAAYDTEAMSYGAAPSRERVWGMLVSGNYFDVFGVTMEKGRGFRADEDTPAGGHFVAVVSDRFWRDRLDAAPDVVGRQIVLNDTSFEVVGVANPDFRGNLVGVSFDLWVPIGAQRTFVDSKERLIARGDRWLETMGRLKPGVTLEAANDEMASIASALAAEDPDTDGTLSLALYPHDDSPKGAGRFIVSFITVLVLAGALVLAIACANVANLLLARAVERRHEIAVRMSLGATRRRVARQLVTESLVLAALGGACGILVAMWGSGLLNLLAPAADYPIGIRTEIDTSAVLVAVAVTIGAGLCFGLVPAIGATRTDLVESIKASGKTHSGGSFVARLRFTLAVAQVSVSLVLLVAAGLALRSLVAATGIDPGFDRSHVAVATVDIFASGVAADDGRQMLKRVLERARALPDAEAVTVARKVPLSFGGSLSRGFEVEGYAPEDGERPLELCNYVGPDYFEVMRIPVLEGRGIEERDDESAPSVVVVNEVFANKYWAGASAIGKRIRFGDKWATVVGVVAPSCFRSLTEQPEPFFYVPVLQNYNAEATFQLRTRGDAAAAARTLRETIQSAAPQLVIFNVATLEERTAPATFHQRAAGATLSVFGGLALVLASVGIAGVLAFAVANRTREFGVRMALGADRRRVLTLVLWEAIRLVGLGIAVGLAISIAASSLLEKMLVGVGPLDPLAFAGATAFLAVVAIGAAFGPALRAASVDPIEALKSE